MHVTIDRGRLRIALSGWDWFLTLRRGLAFPIGQIASVRLSPELGRPYGIKMPGSAISGRLYAGTWRWKGHKEFWNVRREKSKWIAIELTGNEYDLVVLQVEDPTALIDEIERARRT